MASAKKLSNVGAAFVICPDNTVHIAFDKVAARSPLPWLHIAEEVAKEAKRRGFGKLAILGTRFLMESEVYPSKLKLYGIKWAVPEADQREVVNTLIFDELVYGVIKPKSRGKLVSVIRGLAEKEGCDAVVLGCTELPLILDNENSPLPVLDSTRILARAAIKKAIE